MPFKYEVDQVLLLLTQLKRGRLDMLSTCLRCASRTRTVCYGAIVESYSFIQIRETSIVGPRKSIDLPCFQCLSNKQAVPVKFYDHIKNGDDEMGLAATIVSSCLWSRDLEI